MKTIFIHESSKTLDEIGTEECNLSYQEQIDKAKKDCIERKVCNTMSPAYLQAFILYADKYNVLDEWSFIIFKEDGCQEDVTDEKEKAFAMMTQAMDSLFQVGFEEPIEILIVEGDDEYD